MAYISHQDDLPRRSRCTLRSLTFFTSLLYILGVMGDD